MIPKRLESISEDDIQGLISNAISEGRTIDYKREMPGGTDAAKKEYLADISSFANTSGGDLIFGVDEAQGIPTEIVGIASVDPDAEIRRVDSITASGLSPRIRYHINPVDCSGKRVLIVRVERSWVGPHRVIFAGSDKFYARNSTGKYPLDVNELRAAFTFSNTVTERIRAFRTDRIIALSNNETPMPFVEGPKIVLHCIPVEAFAGNSQYDVMQFYHDLARLRPMVASGWTQGINLDGVFIYSGNNPAYSYTQIRRNGVIEVVDGSILNPWGEQKLISHVVYEGAILSYLPYCIQKLQELGCSAPVVVALTLTNIKGFQMELLGYMPSLVIRQPISLETLMLPEAVVEDLAEAPDKILKPMFDLVWNACGLPESKNFDREGKWKHRQ
jgi:Putative DNA-binding domain